MRLTQTMHRNDSVHRQILDENMQIVRATLAAITEDVRSFSGAAADAVKEAVEKLDHARREFSRREPSYQPAELHPVE